MRTNYTIIEQKYNTYFQKLLLLPGQWRQVQTLLKF